MHRYSFYIALASTLVCSLAYATGPKSKVVPLSDLRSLSITIKVDGVSSHKKIYCLNKTPGAATKTKGGMIFTSFAATIANLQSKNITGVKLETFRQLNKVGKSNCARAPQGGNPSPTPTPRPTGPGPKPTATPTNQLNFDANGDLTSRGKAEFGVPSNLNGSISAGAGIYADYCTCHTPPWNHNFSDVRGLIAGPPASFNSNEITDPMLANIIAYLNQFNLDH